MLSARVGALGRQTNLPSRPRSRAATPTTQPRNNITARTTPRLLLTITGRRLPTLKSDLTSIGPTLRTALRRRTSQTTTLPRNGPLTKQIRISSRFNLHHGPFNNLDCRLRRNVSFTKPINRPVLTAKSKIMIATACSHNCNGCIGVGRNCNCRALCTRVTRLRMGTNSHIQHNRVINALNDAKHSSNPRLRCDVCHRKRTVGPHHCLGLSNTPGSAG